MNTKVDYIVRNRPSATTLGVTEIVYTRRNPITGLVQSQTHMGFITKKRNVDEVTAFVELPVSRERIEVGVFKTRSQAAHAIRRKFTEVLGHREPAEAVRLAEATAERKAA